MEKHIKTNHSVPETPVVNINDHEVIGIKDNINSSEPNPKVNLKKTQNVISVTSGQYL